MNIRIPKWLHEACGDTTLRQLVWTIKKVWDFVTNLQMPQYSCVLILTANKGHS